MITKYSLTNPYIDGDITLMYEDGLLVEYVINGSISPKALQSLIAKFPLTIELLQELLKNPNTKAVVLPPDLSFARFWNKYAYKPPGSSKKLAEAKWNKMNEAERMAAMQYIPVYDMSLNNGIGKKYAETYLNQKIWEK